MNLHVGASILEHEVCGAFKPGTPKPTGLGVLDHMIALETCCFYRCIADFDTVELSLLYVRSAGLSSLVP